MAILKTLNIGDISGRYGNIIVYQCEGRTLMRTMPKKTNHKATQNQLVYRAKFTLVARFLSPLRSFIAKSYTFTNSVGRQRLSRASSYHIQDAVVGEYPSFEIDYNKVLLSQGELPSMASPVITMESGMIQISWQDNSSNGMSAADDLLTVVAYCRELDKMVICEDVVNRKDCIFTWEVPIEWGHGLVQLWRTFRNGNALFSNSIYLGAVAF